MVLEVLTRLPVKPLLRFKTVCRSWRAAISSPSFVAAHLRRQRQPTVLIAPQLLNDAEPDIVWPTNFSDTISLYKWRQQNEGAGAGRCQPSLQEKLPWGV
ncbi:hypothetical protein E2562_012766 [Oryza meyeriana var. granulata]|uniref:F-box domain-containing protein n=1 Tax=Oryza meyeriana var. granulata TaxID=110450 RepID=A0A6G1DIC9_9ORYZ|nr:hypothetical protein E2562_012766 [Oryza meyeriana var. granulata]